MTPTAPVSAAPPAPTARIKLGRDTVFLIGDVLPLLDFVGVLLAAWLGTLLYAAWVLPGAPIAGILDNAGRAALVAAVLAPLILCDRAFVSFASGGQTTALIRCYTVRFVMFAGAVALIGVASRSLVGLPHALLAAWFAATLGVTAVSRLLLVATLRHLERKGILVETIAVIGSGPLADRLIRDLRQTRGNTVEIVGVFDDVAAAHGRDDVAFVAAAHGRDEVAFVGAAHGRDEFAPTNRAHGALPQTCLATPSVEAAYVGAAHGRDGAPTGSIADLLELGKSRPLDWILLALPDSAQGRLPLLVHRLKALAVPIGLCPHGADPAVRATLAAARPGASWGALLAALEPVLPRWILTLLGLPLTALRRLIVAVRALAQRRAAATPPLTCRLDDYDLPRFTEVAARFGQQRFGYVVTPNADHLIRLHQDSAFRALYADAAYVLLDSRFIAHLLRFTRKLALPVCTGGDLTAKLFDEVIAPGDGLVLIGGSTERAARLTRRYGLKRLAHFNPPRDFIRDPDAVDACLRFVEAHSPFRYCLLAVGAPQQEVLAQRLKQRGIARGLALCVGASIDYLTGEERRAPPWMQRAGLEWLFRLSQAPGRMAWRYLVRGPQLFWLLGRTAVVLRPPAPLVPRSPRLRATRRVRSPVAARRVTHSMNEPAPGP